MSIFPHRIESPTGGRPGGASRRLPLSTSTQHYNPGRPIRQFPHEFLTHAAAIARRRLLAAAPGSQAAFRAAVALALIELRAGNEVGT